MSTKITDLTDISERLAKIRRAYGNRIDLPDLGRAAFAMLIGVSAIEYEAYERGDRVPTVQFLAVLHNKTGITWDRSGTVRSPTLPDPSQRPPALAANHPPQPSRPPARPLNLGGLAKQGSNDRPGDRLAWPGDDGERRFRMIVTARTQTDIGAWRLIG